MSTDACGELASFLDGGLRGVDDVTAAKQALAEMAAGDVGIPLDEFDRQFRKEFGIDAKPPGSETC